MDRNTDYFTLFGLPRRYALDLEALNVAYRALLAKVHPDRVAMADAATKRRAVDDAAHANDAYRTLKDPVQRAAYLLQCYGEAPLGANEQLPMVFLQEQLVAREAADEAWDLQDDQQLRALLASLGVQQQQHQQALTTLLDTSKDSGVPGAEQLAYARQHALSLQFLTRFANDLEEKIEG